ncbi:hypothetical protein BLOT_000337 [Blomia tropicalis]|nr:hypothetical protein BLOT_000337 [Blomia tropicalis]
MMQMIPLSIATFSSVISNIQLSRVMPAQLAKAQATEFEPKRLLTCSNMALTDFKLLTSTSTGK